MTLNSLIAVTFTPSEHYSPGMEKPATSPLDIEFTLRVDTCNDDHAGSG